MSRRRRIGDAGVERVLRFEQRLEELSREGDPLEKLAVTVGFEMFRPILLRALRRRRKWRGPGGRLPYDPVLKFKMLVLQALHGLSLAQTSYLLSDRLSWIRFSDLGPGAAVPGDNTLWGFRETLIAAGALEKLFERLNAPIERAGFLAMGEQIVDASIVEAPKQRNTKEGQTVIKAGRVPEEWRDKTRQKDCDALDAEARSGEVDEDGREWEGLLFPVLGCKACPGLVLGNHVSIERRPPLLHPADEDVRCGGA